MRRGVVCKRQKYVVKDGGRETGLLIDAISFLHY